MSSINYSNEYFEVRNSTINGVGCFAKKFIPANTVILEDTPIMLPEEHTDYSNKLEYIYKTAAFLNENFSSDFNNLVPNELIPTNSYYYPILHRKYFPQLAPNQTQLCLQKFLHNAFNFGSSRYCMLFIGCKFNHSCNPSVLFRPFEDKMVFTTVRDINKGDEIFDTYLSSNFTKEQLLNVQLRQTALKANYGFECHCERCNFELNL